MKLATLCLLSSAAVAGANAVRMPLVETNHTGQVVSTQPLTLKLNTGQSIVLPASAILDGGKFVGKRVTVTVVTEQTTGTNTVIRGIRKIEEAPPQPNAKP